MQRPTQKQENFSNQLYTRKKNHTYQHDQPSSSLPTSPDYIRLYIETSIRDLKFSDAHTFEKARLIEF